jgi:uncharacterized protein YgfB (UPF0149 family)
MSETKLPSYLSVATELQNAGLAVTPAELHGLLVGMLAGGLSVTEKTWQPILFDYTNDGLGWPQSTLTAAKSILDHSFAELSANQFQLNLLLPDDDASATIFDVADELAMWVNHFISGLGLIGTQLNKLSDNSKEALTDLEEISKLGIDEDDDMEEQALLLEQVIEHVKACVMTIHAEFGLKAPNSDSKPTIH